MEILSQYESLTFSKETEKSRGIPPVKKED